MPLRPYFSKPWVVDTPADLPPTAMLGMLYETLSPLALYAYTESGWAPLASLAGAALPAVGNHNLYSTTHPDVAGVRADGGVLVWRPAQGASGLYDHEAVSSLLADATEAAAGKVELATAAETQAGTDTSRAVHPAGLKAATTPEAWIAPTLVNSWVNFGTPFEVAGYRKTPSGEVRLKGVIKNGAMAADAPLFTPGVGRDETSLLLAGHVLAICEALGITADPRLSEVVATGEKAMSKKAEIQEAGTALELEGIEWT